MFWYRVGNRNQNPLHIQTNQHTFQPLPSLEQLTLIANRSLRRHTHTHTNNKKNHTRRFKQAITPKHASLFLYR